MPPTTKAPVRGAEIRTSLRKSVHTLSDEELKAEAIDLDGASVHVLYEGDGQVSTAGPGVDAPAPADDADPDPRRRSEIHDKFAARHPETVGMPIPPPRTGVLAPAATKVSIGSSLPISKPPADMTDAELKEEANTHHVAYLAAGRRAIHAHVLPAGRALTEMKRRVEHGRWAGWLKENFKPGSAETARVYMRVATHWDEIQAAGLDTDGITLEILRDFVARLAKSEEVKEDRHTTSPATGVTRTRQTAGETRHSTYYTNHRESIFLRENLKLLKKHVGGENPTQTLLKVIEFAANHFNVYQDGGSE